MHAKKRLVSEWNTALVFRSHDLAKFPSVTNNTFVPSLEHPQIVCNRNFNEFFTKNALHNSSTDDASHYVEIELIELVVPVCMRIYFKRIRLVFKSHEIEIFRIIKPIRNSLSVWSEH